MSGEASPQNAKRMARSQSVINTKENYMLLKTRMFEIEITRVSLYARLGRKDIYFGPC
jgi:hypothetical protein